MRRVGTSPSGAFHVKQESRYAKKEFYWWMCFTCQTKNTSEGMERYAINGAVAIFGEASKHVVKTDGHDVRIGHGRTPSGKLTPENAAKHLAGEISGFADAKKKGVFG